LIPFPISNLDGSLDTSIVLHLYPSGKQELLFYHFEHLYMYEQLYQIEMREWTGLPGMRAFSDDIKDKRICIVTESCIRSIGFWPRFRAKFSEWSKTFCAGDDGEAYAVALAEVLGICYLATDDQKQYGPHDTLVRFPKESNVIPFTFFELLVLDCLKGRLRTTQLYEEFNQVDSACSLNMNFHAKMKSVLRRFWIDPSEKDSEWLKEYCDSNGISLGRISQVKSFLDCL
jgi:hypothetical protein